jgi:hypothetical protein
MSTDIDINSTKGKEILAKQQQHIANAISNQLAQDAIKMMLSLAKDQQREPQPRQQQRPKPHPKPIQHHHRPRQHKKL